MSQAAQQLVFISWESSNVECASQKGWAKTQDSVLNLVRLMLQSLFLNMSSEGVLVISELQWIWQGFQKNLRDFPSIGLIVLGRTIVLRYPWCRLRPCCRTRYCESSGSVSRTALLHYPSWIGGDFGIQSYLSRLGEIYLHISVVGHQCVCGQAMCDKKWHWTFKSGYVGARLLSLETDLGRRAA